MKQQKVHKGGESITALLFPRHCPVCDRLLADDEPYLCRRCASELVFVREPVCMKCGRPLGRESAELCDACRRREHRFIRGFAPFLYRGAVQASVLRFKYGGRAEYAGFYARAICTFGKEKLALWKPACVIPVPVHPLRYCTRGYNQAAVTAVEIARLLNIPECGNLVRRTRNTRQQKGLAPSDRRKNLSGAFHVPDGTVFPETVLLVDDIYTTGATMDELTETVMAHGAKQVYFAAIAIAPGMT